MTHDAASPKPARTGASLRLRLLLPDGAVGPGKIALLEAIQRTGTISGAARSLDMSFRRAWLLIDTMNAMFHEPVVKATVGGRSGGGAELTAVGHELVERFRAIEAAARELATPHLSRLDELAAAPADTGKAQDGGN
jgi:molybdate transport system regulatory protein